MRKLQIPWLTQLAWIGSVLLLIGGLYPILNFFIWKSVSVDSLISHLQIEYIPQQSEQLHQQLERLANACNATAPTVEQLEKELSESIDTKLKNPEISLSFTAGTTMKNQLAEQISSKNIEATPEISAMLDLIEQQGNQLQSQSIAPFNDPALQQYLLSIQQQHNSSRLLIGIALIALSGLGFFVSCKQYHSTLKGLSLAMISIAGLCVMLAFSVPMLSVSSDFAFSTAFHTSIQEWIAPIKNNALLCSGIFVVLALILWFFAYKSKVVEKT